ncbi:hypothetical protein FOYG_05398 [Fusarium oxysporum NRRL 32931]|uniref:Uncharacterized protein n=1 Tax=Fusarium oxysporum NRRL 32931 TaxID=660029 RepID=W9IQ82_FUSOX|nr:hypothetical protein FOYG_05398 [Fusarium oxysporum NRRL 32931]
MRDSEPSNQAAHMPTLQPQKCMGALHGVSSMLPDETKLQV